MADLIPQTATPILPNAKYPLPADDGTLTLSWRRWVQDVQVYITTLEARISALENP